MEPTIAEIEAQKEDLKKLVEFRDQILKLSANHEFRKVIQDGFLRDEAARSARMAGDPNIDANARASLIEMALSAGHLQRFLSANIQMGNVAENQLKQADELLDEMRAEEAE